MIAVKPWLEREFMLDAPKWMYPQFVERVGGGPARVEEAVRGLSAAVLIYRPGDAWSIQEEVGHLLELEALWAKRLEQFIAGEALLKAWPGSNEATWKAEYNRQSLDSILQAFRRSREAMVSRFEFVPEEIIERSAFHPRVQKQMRTVDLAAYISEHDDHHLARIAAKRQKLQRGSADYQYRGVVGGSGSIS